MTFQFSRSTSDAFGYLADVDASRLDAASKPSPVGATPWTCAARSSVAAELGNRSSVSTT
jgi:hypothetical protein